MPPAGGGPGSRPPPAAGGLPRAAFERAYALLSDLTPLKEDCGALCAARCCRGTEEQAGMYLFPGEECMFTGEEDWLRSERHPVSERVFCPEWEGAIEAVTFVVCRGTCPRARRPLACRLFPMAPLFAPGRAPAFDFEVVFDPDAAFLCPLARHGLLTQLDPDFVAACGRVLALLASDPLILADFRWRSARWLAESEKPDPWKRLLE